MLIKPTQSTIIMVKALEDYPFDSIGFTSYRGLGMYSAVIDPNKVSWIERDTVVKNEMSRIESGAFDRFKRFEPVNIGQLLNIAKSSGKKIEKLYGRQDSESYSGVDLSHGGQLLTNGVIEDIRTYLGMDVQTMIDVFYPHRLEIPTAFKKSSNIGQKLYGVSFG